MRVRIGCLILLVLPGIACLLARRSYNTTRVSWDGQMPEGTWTLYCKDESGAPVSGAAIELVDPKTKQSVGYPDGPFDNYNRPGSVVSDSGGRIELHNTRRLRYGGTCWKLFWIWPIGDLPQDSPRSLLLQMSATGYQPALLELSALFAQPSHVVTLKKAGAKQ